MHDDQKTSEYPPGYTPMTDEELNRVWLKETGGLTKSHRAIERAVLARLPKPDTAEREALVQQIDAVFALNGASDFRLLRAHKALAAVRAHLVGGEL